MSIPAFTRFDAVPVRGMNEREFDEAALSFFPKLVPFSEELIYSFEWLEAKLQAVDQASEGAHRSAKTAGDKAFEAGQFANAASKDAERAESAVARLPEGTIADEVVAPDKVWSSQKMSAEVEKKRDVTDGSFARVDYASAVATDVLDLAQRQVFRLYGDGDTVLTLSLANAPDGPDRAMIVVVHIYGNPAVAWPDEWQAPDAWDGGKLPKLGDVSSKIVAMYDGEGWSVTLREAK